MYAHLFSTDHHFLSRAFDRQIQMTSVDHLLRTNIKVFPKHLRESQGLNQGIDRQWIHADSASMDPLGRSAAFGAARSAAFGAAVGERESSVPGALDLWALGE